MWHEVLSVLSSLPPAVIKRTTAIVHRASHVARERNLIVDTSIQYQASVLPCPTIVRASLAGLFMAKNEIVHRPETPNTKETSL
jgi:hypothetical protein